jgi:hypothetical protein
VLPIIYFRKTRDIFKLIYDFNSIQDELKIESSFFMKIPKIP